MIYVNLIAKKLKAQLKGIRSEGKSDPEKIINLTIKVRTVVEKLRTMKKEAALQHDTEFLAAVYCALPSKHQQRWLDYPKTGEGGESHWADMLAFLDKADSQANEELVLLSTYSLADQSPSSSSASSSGPKKLSRASSAATKVTSTAADSDSENAPQQLWQGHCWDQVFWGPFSSRLWQQQCLLCCCQGRGQP